MINPCVNNTNGWNIWKTTGSPNFRNHQLYQFDVSTGNSDPMGWAKKRKVTYSKFTQHTRSFWKKIWLISVQRVYWTFPHAPYLQSLESLAGAYLWWEPSKSPMYIVTPPRIIFTRIWQTAMRHNGWLAVVSPQILYMCLIHRRATD